MWQAKQRITSRIDKTFLIQSVLIIQRALFCGCGCENILARGMCASCYFARYRDERHFAGQRERTLKRDRRMCTACGAGNQLVVHHREPGVNVPRLFATLCRRCHARVHRLRQARYGMTPHLRELWDEQHRGQVQQLEFPLTVEGPSGTSNEATWCCSGDPG